MKKNEDMCSSYEKLLVKTNLLVIIVLCVGFSSSLHGTVFSCFDRNMGQVVENTSKINGARLESANQPLKCNHDLFLTLMG